MSEGYDKAAKLLIRSYGPQAAEEADRQAMLFEREHKTGSAEHWRALAAAIRKQLAANPPGGLTEKDIWRTAHFMVQRHGGRAELEAAGKAEALLKSGDLEAGRTWRRVRDAIRRQQGRVGEGAAVL